MFIIYDIDLVFFLVEVMVWDIWTCADIFIIASLLLLILVGFFFDLRKKVLFWF